MTTAVLFHSPEGLAGALDRPQVAIVMFGAHVVLDERMAEPHWHDSQNEVRPSLPGRTLTGWLPGSLLPPPPV